MDILFVCNPQNYCLIDRQLEKTYRHNRSKCVHTIKLLAQLNKCIITKIPIDKQKINKSSLKTWNTIIYIYNNKKWYIYIFIFSIIIMYYFQIVVQKIIIMIISNMKIISKFNNKQYVINMYNLFIKSVI